MQVLQDQGEGPLASIVLPRLTNAASRRVSPKCFVIGSAIVIARQPETSRRPKNQKRGRKWQEDRPPGGSWSKPTVRRIPEDFRRIKRRKIWAEVIMITLKRSPCCIDHECRQTTKNRQRLDPPHVLTFSRSKASGFQRRCCLSRHHVPRINSTKKEAIL